MTDDPLLALALTPAVVLARAVHLRRSGQPQEAAALVADLVLANPDRGDLWLASGASWEAAGDTSKAERALQRAVKLIPERFDAWLHLGRMVAVHGRRPEAAEHYARAVELAPAALWPRIRLASCLISLGALDEAEPHVHAALALDIAAPEARAVAARLAQRRGDLERAWAWVAGQPPSPFLVEISASLALSRGRPGDALPMVEQALASATGGPRAVFAKLAGDLYDALGRVDDAFAAWTHGNRARGLRFDPHAHRRAIADLVVRTAGPWRARHHAEADRPVLICGVPRSGTTLLEQALGCHPDVAAGGELPTLRELGMRIRRPGDGDWADAMRHTDNSAREEAAQAYLGRLRQVDPTASRVIDKMPNNLLQLGFLAYILPGTRVIVCERDPVDVGFSCFRQVFGPGLPWATELAWIACWIETCHILHAAWRERLPLRFHEVRYEALVSEPERVLRDVLQFLDLPWDPAVLRPEAHGRAVATASALEVEAPIHTRSIGRASAYARHLGPLLALGGRDSG